ncbi:MAG: TIR domain-containing protein [Pyrinomonadaceae bacterium]
MSESYDTFLSYASTDREYVRPIYDYLTEKGLRVWFDQVNIRPGDNWIADIAKGLENSKSCVVFFRKEPGVWHQRETEIAIGKRETDKSFKIFPVILQDADDPEPSLPAFLRSTALVDLRGGLRNLQVLWSLVAAIRGDQSVPIYRVPEETADDDGRPKGYRAEVNKIIALLIGEALYSRRDVSIRELIQNAVDACERRVTSHPSVGGAPAIQVVINSEEGFFEVSDNGDGMNLRLLSEYFAVIGKSIRDEEDIIERAQDDEHSRAQLISKFGIGFISVYMLAKRVLVSTTYEGCEQINLEIRGISERFSYPDTSPVGRPPSKVGTTVRVYFKDKFRKPGASDLNPQAAVEEFCRHVRHISVIKDGALLELKDSWNTEGAAVVGTIEEESRYELRLGLSHKNLGFYASNAGFLIDRRVEEITPYFMPTNIGGEINFNPGVIDLNMARDRIVANEKSAQVRREVSDAIREFLGMVVEKNTPGTQKILQPLLVTYLDAALKYEESAGGDHAAGGRRTSRDRDRDEAPPLSSIEAAELLLKTWLVELDGKQMSLRDALGTLKERDKFRVYYCARYYDQNNLFAIIRDILKKLGFLVIQDDMNKIEFKSGHDRWARDKQALEQLAKKYYFDLHSIEKPLPADILVLVTPDDKVSPQMLRVMRSIEKSRSEKVYLSRLKGAPVVFEIGGNIYLNLESVLIKKLERWFLSYDDSILKSYILGLLKYEIR